MSVRVAFDMCLHLFFIHFYLRFLLGSHLRHASLALLFSFSQLFHLMRCELKRREVCNTWRLELSFMRLGGCPAHLAGVGFYVPMQMAH